MVTEPDAAKAADLILVEDRLWVASAPTGVPGYDFAFGNFFHCKRPWDRPAVVHAVGRIGAPLRSVGEPDDQGIPPSFEFRTFCWNGCLVGDGPYWPAADYGWSGSDRRAGLELAEEAARRINVAFPVIDVAQTADGRWIVIECNDGQESGYTGASALGIWANVIALLKDVSV